MKTRSYMIAITMAFFISMPSYAADVPSNLDTGNSADLEIFSSEELDADDDLDEPVSESDIGSSINFSSSEPVVVDNNFYFDNGFDFDDSFYFDNNDDEASLLTTPIPAAIWLFGTGLLGLSRIVKHHKKA